MQRHQITYHIQIQGVGVASRHWSGKASEASNTSKNPTEQETSNPQGNFQLGLKDWQNSVMMGTHEQNSLIARICL